MNTSTKSDLEWEKTSFKSWLRLNDMIITFTKDNGEERIMRCTLRPEALPTPELNKEEVGYGTSESVLVWDLDVRGWRRFKPSKVKESYILYKEETKMDKIIGTCSKCGGNVFEQTEKCVQCGAVKKEKKLPVIEMDESTGPKLLLD